MKHVSIIKMWLAFCVAFAMSCDPYGPHEDDMAGQQYRFAVEVLDNFFIYREQLPPDMYAFENAAALFESVNEPYTHYYNAQQAAYLMSMLSTKEGGIGIRIDSVAGGYLIKDVFSGSPGEKAGLKSLDTIVLAGDISVAGMAWQNFSLMLRGDIGTAIKLRVKRGADYYDYKITRGEYISPSVFVDSVSALTASIMLTGFFNETNMDGGSAAEIARALDSTSWAQYTIIDLQGNGGGYVNQCIQIVSLLVENGTPIIKVRERTIDTVTWKSVEIGETLTSTGPGTYATRKLYLLVDSMTASASEIMVNCLMHRDGVMVLGDTTFGKARGQIILDGPGSTLAKVTCMTLNPVDAAEKSYDLVGISPDITTDTSDAFDMALNEIENVSAAAKRLAHGGWRHPARCDAAPHMKEPAAIWRVTGLE